MSIIVTSVAILLGSAHAHSWVRCSDYKSTITGGDYDEDQCSGWIRGWEFDGIEFSDDRGINHQVGVGGGQSLCQETMESSSTNYGYTDTDKIPSYSPGSSVRLVWPAKNHANYECFEFIPDTEMKLYWNPNVNPSADLSNTEGTMEDQGYELVKDWHDGCTPGTDGCGFQNCPKFCEDTDGATCFGDFTVPDVDASGYYTFVWYWVFNPGSPYITCWEAYIDKDGEVAKVPTVSPDPDSTTETPEISDDAIVVTNDQSMQAWYVRFTMDHIDDCFEQIAAVQLDRGNGVYQDNDQYYYSNGHKYAFFNDGTSFADLLPISLRILFDDGSYVDLEDIITDFVSGSVFTSSKSCDGEVVTDTDDSSEVLTSTCEATVADCSDEWEDICSNHFASAHFPMVNEQAVGTMNNANAQKSGFTVELTAQELWKLLSVSVVFNAVMVLVVVYVCRHSGKRQRKYDPVEFETESEMEDIRQ